MPGPPPPDDPINSPPETRGKQVAPGPEPDAGVLDERQRIEREVYERRTFKDRGSEAHWQERTVPPLTAESLRGAQPAAAGPEAAGASGEPSRALGAAAHEELGADNKQQGAPSEPSDEDEAHPS